MSENTKPLVIVLSRNYSTGLGIIRSLGMTGEYVIDMVASTAKKGRSIITASSRYLRKTAEVVSTQTTGEAGDELVDALLSYVGTYDGEMIIFPTDDFTASVMDRNREVLEKHFLMPHVESGFSILELMDKTIQSRLALKAGLLTPMEWVISLREEDISIPESMKYPCFVKPLKSVSGQKTEMKRCDDSIALEIHLKKMQNTFRDRDVLVQEYLEIEKEYDLSGVCLNQKIIIPAIIEKTQVAQYHRGVTMAGKMISASVLCDIYGSIMKMLKSFGYTGMFDMEFNVSRGRIYFNEINLRSGGPNFAYFMSGANLPDLLVKALLGRPYPPEEENVTVLGKNFIYEKVCWEDYINGYMTHEEMEKHLADADFKLLDHPDDPEPGRVFAKRIRLSAMKHRLLHLIHRD